MNTKAPLAIHIICHEDFEDKELYERAIFSTFNRDIENYLERGINIPVYFTESSDIKDNSSKYVKNVVVIFVDDEMLLDSSFNLDDIFTDSSLRIIPVAITSNAHKKHSYISDHSFLRAYDYKEKEQQTFYVLFELGHEIYKYLTQKDELSIFLSHAKLDGEDIAKKFKNYIDNDTKLKSFFDATDIQNLHEWAKVLEEGVDSSILLAIQTDKYSSREWCRKEVLLAKKYNVPIVAVNSLERFEDRGFPYMGNMPTITMSDTKDNYQEIIFHLLIESVRSCYQEVFIKYFMKLFFDKAEYSSLSFAPELLTLAHHDNEKSIFIYPDPPLGLEELNLLNGYDDTYAFYTPLNYITNNIDFSSLNIAISVSESQNCETSCLSDIHLKDFIIELTRYLLSAQSTLLYGGDIRYDGDLNFAQIIADLARTYQNTHDETVAIQNYVSYPFSKKIDKKLKGDMLGIVDFIPIERDDSLEDENEDYITSETLRKMRTEMNDKLDVRIIAGGKLEGFSGKYPGILEEAYMALKSNKAVFLVGAFGGATKKIIEAVEGNKPEEFTLEYQFKYDKFKTLYNKYEDKDKFGYGNIVSFLNSQGIDRLNNGLSREENEILFESKNVHEILFFIFKGITNLNGGNDE